MRYVRLYLLKGSVTGQGSVSVRPSLPILSPRLFVAVVETLAPGRTSENKLFFKQLLSPQKGWNLGCNNSLADSHQYPERQVSFLMAMRKPKI